MVFNPQKKSMEGWIHFLLPLSIPQNPVLSRFRFIRPEGIFLQDKKSVGSHRIEAIERFFTVP
jgi:hypothetical protein